MFTWWHRSLGLSAGLSERECETRRVGKVGTILALFIGESVI